VYKRTLGLSLYVSLLIICTPSKAAIDIIFDYSYDTNNYFTDEMKYVMDQAAFAFESRMANETLGSLIPSDYNSSAVGILMIDNPTTGADLNVTFGSTTSEGNLVGKEDEIIIFAGAKAVGSSYLSYSRVEYNYNDLVNGDPYWDYMENRDYGYNDPAVFGGSLSINSDLNWYADTNLTSHSDALTSGKYDFYSTAVHELGHILGFNYWTFASWDLVDVNETVFNTSSVRSEYSGNDVPMVVDSMSLHFGDLNSSLINCDCHPAMSDINSTNTRTPFSDIDFAILQDLGYSISGTPISNIGGTYQDPTLGGSYYVPVKQSYSSWLAANASAAPEPHYIFPMLGGLIACFAGRKKYINLINRFFN